ncbi:MAG: hypothetical protein ACJ8FY_13805 [Gemmataceae bacterium]
MIEVMSRCAKCGATTDGGQYYRFYFGVFMDEPARGPTPHGEPLDPGLVFQVRGSEEVYYCDRCLVRAATWGQMARSLFFLLLGLFALAAVVALALTSSPGLWCGVVVLLLVATLGYVPYRRYRRLRAALGGGDVVCLRELVRADPPIQNMGDAWAIAQRRQALQATGADTFLTRKEHEWWSRPLE